MKSKRRKWTYEKYEKETYKWKVREGNVQMKSEEKEMYLCKVRERNVRMKSKRKKYTYEK